jgi:hypothetical protein
MNKYLLTIFLGLLTTQVAFGQEQRCTQNLEEAQLRYDEGRIQDIEDLLVACLNEGAYSKSQSETALRLMILANIFMEEEGRADTLMLELLETSHEFKPDPVLDPTEFINLYNTYNTEPIFNVGVKFGQNWSLQQVDQFHTIGQPGAKYEYSVINGIYASILFEWSFHERFYLYPEISYSLRRYSKESEFPGLITDVFSTNEILESYTWLELPVTVQYVLLDNPNVQPYIFAGGSVSYLLASEYPGDLNSRTRTGNSEIKLATVSSLEDRNQINANATLGAGIKLKAGEGFITAELRASYMITQLTKNENSLTPTNDPDLVHGLWEWYDSFKQHYAAITIGYTKNIYKPKKK